VRRSVVLLVAVALLAGGAALILVGGAAIRSRPPVPADVAAVSDPADADGSASKRLSSERPAFKGRERQSAADAGGEETDQAAAADTGLPDDAAGPVGTKTGAAGGPPAAAQPPERRQHMILFQPVATAAGTIEVKGYRIAFEGIEPIGPDETCDAQGRSWPCGARARAAFRAWLRGRSVTCEVPPQPGSETIVAPCRMGTEDIAEWLVENGWARPAADGPYVALGETAAQAGKGVFGAAPAMTAPAEAPAGSQLPAPPAPGAIMAAPGAEPPPEIIVPPTTGPVDVFPTPPAPPPAPAQ
jgi:hypothetical protein